MTPTSDIVQQMFINLAKLRLEPEIIERITPVVDGLMQRLKGNLDLSTEEGWNRLRIALCGMLAHGWALGMSPFNSPAENVDGDPIEVRVSRDILAPIEVLQSIRYAKKDSHGRIQKVLFEPSAEVRVKEQIDSILREVEQKHWKE
ncbi:MAG: hypothetical protein JW958_08830 [Candidatus Eisenbacteria bacterium]|nr:hypothetical protein [Candidatus Eisenbacteria bacterium]